MTHEVSAVPHDGHVRLVLARTPDLAEARRLAAKLGPSWVDPQVATYQDDVEAEVRRACG